MQISIQSSNTNKTKSLNLKQTRHSRSLKQCQSVDFSYDSITRFKKLALFTTLSLGLLGTPYLAHAACAPAPTSSTVINVRSTGATPNDSTNDTYAIQAAINKVPYGGTVYVPDGIYWINAVTSLRLKNNMTFSMSRNAILRAIPNGSSNYNIISLRGVYNVNIVGGTVQGDRYSHSGRGEWGMGIGLYGARNVVVENVTAKDTFGDGFYVGAPNSSNVKFCSVVADNNRRTGLGIIDASGVVVTGSSFQNTNGTMPQAGIDIEPNYGNRVSNVQVIGSRFLNNRKLGFLSVTNAAPISNVRLQGNYFSGNYGGYWLDPRIAGASAFNNLGQR